MTTFVKQKTNTITFVYVLHVKFCFQFHPEAMAHVLKVI